MNSVSQKVVVQNSLGLHMRPVARFVDLAKQFDSHIRIRKGNYIANGNDSMAMMLLEATQGTELELLADGCDADRAIDALVNLIEKKFGED